MSETGWNVLRSAADEAHDERRTAAGEMRALRRRNTDHIREKEQQRQEKTRGAKLDVESRVRTCTGLVSHFSH